MKPRRKGQTIHSEARNIIRRLIKKCDEEARNNQLFYTVQQVTLRVSEYTGISVRTISRIRKEDSETREDELLSSPGKKRPRAIEKKFHCSEEEKKIIRDIIHKFYVEKRIIPTASKLLVAIQEKINFPWKRDTLYRLLKSMGFKWKKGNSIRRILVEKPHIVAWRVKYLQTIRQHREANRNIIYIGETSVDNNLRFSKYWQDEETLAVLKSATHRFIVVHAGGQTGFVQNAKLIFKTENHHGQMNADIFENWVRGKLQPNIPANSVIVMDNAPYHSVQVNKAPTKYSTKSDMINWLVENNIPYEESMRKYELYEQIRRNKAEKIFKIDQFLKDQGHDVVRLPPYMCDFNPIELAWAEVKRRIQESNPSMSTNNNLEQQLNDTINAITPDDWKKYCQDIGKAELLYWERDNLLERTIDELIAQETMDIESDSEESSSEDDSE